MKKLTLPNGYISYSCSAFETGLLGGMGVCDDCGRFSPRGYLVPILNHYMCPKCFDDWKHRCRYYPEDIPYESKNAAYYESRIPMEVNHHD